MADFYCDVSAVGNEYQAYADTPTTWGVPQDGNGKAKDGGVSAVFEIDCTGCAASGTGTINVLGQNVSTTLNASGSALATAIVTAVNASATATISTYSALLLPVNRMVFARVKPAAANVVQIMMRIAGADWNSLLPTQANISPAATIMLETTGVDGPFGYYVNATACFGKLANTYGCLISAPASVVSPKLTTDGVYVRTKRSAANLSVANSFSTSIAFRPPATENRCFIFDNGVTWAGDSGVFAWNITSTSGSAYPIISSATGDYWLRFLAAEEGGMSVTYTGVAGSPLKIGGQGRVEIFGAVFTEANSVSVINPASIGSLGCHLVFTRCSVVFRSAHVLVADLNSNTSSSYVAFLECAFTWIGIGTNVTGLVTGAPSNAAYPITIIRFTNCDFTVDGGAYSVTNPCSAATWVVSMAVSVAFSNCQGLFNPSAGVPAAKGIGVPTFLWDGVDNGRSFRYETMNYTLDWIDNGTYPYYNTQLASGTYMSHRLTWETARVQEGYSFSVGRYGAWYKDVPATKTVALELLVPTAEIPSKSQFGISVKYTGQDGNIYYETSLEASGLQAMGIGPAMADGVGTGAWTLNGTVGVSSKKLTVTTANAVKQNSEITAELIMYGPPISNRIIYINPDLVLS